MANPSPVRRPGSGGRSVAPQPIEPGRLRRIGRRAEPISGRLDLHGLDQASARDALIHFILKAHSAGGRAVLVVTGKGMRGEGVLRRRVPEWLAAPPLRSVVAGISEAGRKDGGAGAIYVALRRAGLP
jgi:DNA-nicking Smr family endonuclease